MTTQPTDTLTEAYASARTILGMEDVTPTWTDLVDALLAIAGTDYSAARVELVRMATAADAWNERVRTEGVYIRRPGGTEAEGRALARAAAAEDEARYAAEDDGWVCHRGHPTTAPVAYNGAEYRFCPQCEDIGQDAAGVGEYHEGGIIVSVPE
jgi:hypothetical protein